MKSPIFRARDSSLARNVVAPQDLTRAKMVAPTRVVTPLQRRARSVRRSRELIDAVLSLDTASDDESRRDLVNWINGVYEGRDGGVLLGLFGRCYLGEPFVDHRMTLDGGIVEHFKDADAIPPAFAAARALARSPSYIYIEVYSDGQIVPIRSDGAPAI